MASRVRVSTLANRMELTNLTEKLSSDPDVVKAYYTQVLYAPYNGVIGGIGYEFPLLPPEEVPFVVKILGA